jgi:hypothetical protein
MAYPYPDRLMRWPDGSSIPVELQDMLRAGLQSGFEIEHAEFAWNADNSLAMTFRLSVTKDRRGSQIWEIAFSYPAGEATAVLPEATPAEREWFAMMVRTHVTEWWDGGPSVVTSARRMKLRSPRALTWLGLRCLREDVVCMPPPVG